MQENNGTNETALQVAPDLEREIRSLTYEEKLELLEWIRKLL